MNRSLSPFALDDADTYRRWRDAKLENYPTEPQALVVELDDPRRLREAEFEALYRCIAKTNMALYASATGDDPDKAIPRTLAERFGLRRLNHNWLADEDGLTSLTVNAAGERPAYIPYTNRPIKWHTDGYYNPADNQCHGMMLHCVHPAASGGANGLLDPELVYIALRDTDPQLVRALMQDEVMCIPPGTDMHGRPRGEARGPVFSVRPDGALHMRYTARARNVLWKDDAPTRAARAALEGLLEQGLPGMVHATLDSGMGLICNNVLHDRAGFSDVGGGPQRLLYRARYYDRIARTAPGDIYDF